MYEDLSADIVCSKILSGLPDLMMKLFFAKGNISDRDFQFDFVNLYSKPSTRKSELFTFKHLYILTIASIWR